jgi:hypothetical protein
MGVIVGLAVPNLPLAPGQYDRSYHNQFSNSLRLFFNQIASALNSPTPHASYYDTTTQTNPVADSVNLFSYDSVVSEFQIARGIPATKIIVNEAGMYNFQFSAQLDKTGGGATDVFIWARVNGTNVPYSTTKVVIDGPNNEIVPSWNFLLDMDSGDYFELAWQSPDTNVVIASAAAASNYPETPSIIMTVVRVSNYES